jgi:hypothetical protein
MMVGKFDMKGLARVSRPLYSPYLSPCDFDFFRMTKRKLKDREIFYPILWSQVRIAEGNSGEHSSLSQSTSLTSRTDMGIRSRETAMTSKIERAFKPRQ